MNTERPNDEVVERGSRDEGRKGEDESWGSWRYERGAEHNNSRLDGIEVREVEKKLSFRACFLRENDQVKERKKNKNT